MTKKQEIIEFATNKLDNTTNILQLTTALVGAGTNTGLNVGDCCVLDMHASKQRTIEVLSNYFNDELVGHMPNDAIQHKVISWNIIGRI